MLTPPQIAANYMQTAEAKVRQRAPRMLLLAIMAGMFVGIACIGANTVNATVDNPSLARLLSAAIFPAALVMVLMAGSELFTGNNLLVIPLLSRRISSFQLLRNWFIVYIGNFVGSLVMVGLMLAGQQYELLSGAVALKTMSVAAAKLTFSFPAAIALGVGCNFLVCIACWIAMAADSVQGKLLGLYLPIVIFVISGFEHSVANMYYVPAGIVLAQQPATAALAEQAGIAVSSLTWGNFLWGNLLPVTIGNIIGGSLLVGCVYWYCYVKNA